jgi:hypothetical protein
MVHTLPYQDKIFARSAHPVKLITLKMQSILYATVPEEQKTERFDVVRWSDEVL